MDLAALLTEPAPKEKPPVMRVEAHYFDRDVVLRAWQELSDKLPFLRLGMATLSTSEVMIYEMLKTHPDIVKLEKEQQKAARRGSVPKRKSSK